MLSIQLDKFQNMLSVTQEDKYVICLWLYSVYISTR